MWTGLAPHFLTSGRNAKTDFPLDYEAYFNDDVEVIAGFAPPRVKTIIEPWQPPHVDTLVHTRKTTLTTVDGARFMLGSVAVFDDVEVGTTRFRASALPPALPPLEQVGAAWYDQAWAQLPTAACVVDLPTSQAISLNHLASERANLLPALLDRVLPRVHATASADSWELGSVPMGSDLVRVWAWRPQPSNPDLIALSFRAHLPAVPELVAKRGIIAAPC